jgi:hypothetical protein
VKKGFASQGLAWVLTKSPEGQGKSVFRDVEEKMNIALIQGQGLLKH